MNLRSRIVLSLVFASAIGATATAQDAAAPVVVAESNGIRLSIVFVGDTAEVTVASKVSGWVAVGFDPTNMMANANFLIGYVKDGTAVARDDFGVASTSHAPDVNVGGKNDLISFSGTEADGYTMMTFVIPRDSGDPKDHPLSAGKHTVILGASSFDSFTAKHTKVGRATIVIP